jgi:drug/metabolite transporter (DMT)-like permease
MPLSPASAGAGELAALATAVCWTGSALANEAAARRMGVLSLNLLRLVLGSLLLAATASLVRGRAFPLDVPGWAFSWLLLSGLLGLVFGDFCLFRAFVLIGVRRSMLVATVTPALAALIAWPVLGERLVSRDLLGMALTVAGVGTVVVGRRALPTPGATALWPGVPLALAGALGQAAGLVLAKVGLTGSTGMAPVHPIAATQIRLVAGLIGFAALITLSRRWRRLGAAAGDAAGLGLVVLAAVFGPCLGITLSLYAVAHAQAGVASSLMSLTPIFLVPVARLRGEPLGLPGVLGPLLAVAGVVLLTG